MFPREGAWFLSWSLEETQEPVTTKMKGNYVVRDVSSDSSFHSGDRGALSHSSSGWVYPDTKKTPGCRCHVQTCINSREGARGWLLGAVLLRGLMDAQSQMVSQGTSGHDPTLIKLALKGQMRNSFWLSSTKNSADRLSCSLHSAEHDSGTRFKTSDASGAGCQMQLSMVAGPY